MKQASDKLQKQQAELKALKTKHGKRYRDSVMMYDRQASFTLTEALGLVKGFPYQGKMKQNVRLSLRLGVDPRHADQMVRGTTSLPHGTGKEVKVAVFTTGDKQQEALAAGADLVGAEDLVQKIQKGEINATQYRYIATPDMMGKLAMIAKILGPHGLMPNPKLGTVTTDVAGVVKTVKTGQQVEFRVDKAGIIHVPVGKLNFSSDQLAENIMAVISAVIKAKPAGAKGTYMKTAAISSTLSPGVKVSVTSLLAQ